MSGMKQRTLDFLNDEWATYVSRFRSLPAEAGAEAVKAQGYDSFHDLLAHITRWWDEGLPLIRAYAAGNEPAAKKYDFDTFNAESVALYKDWSEADLLAHFEAVRREFIALAASLSDQAWAHRRVQSWSYGIVVEHAKEHGFGVSRLVALDTLRHEWAEYAADFDRRPPERQAAFLERQGYASFRDLLAHIIAWWEVALPNLETLRTDPDFTGPAQDVDDFNAGAVRRFESFSEEQVRARFENLRRDLEKLVADMPDEVLNDARVNRQLYMDVIEHYFEHK